jgi:hypothetical protein
MKLDTYQIIRYLPLPIWLGLPFWILVKKAEALLVFFIAHFVLFYVSMCLVSIYLIVHDRRNKWLIAIAIIPGLNVFLYLAVAFEKTFMGSKKTKLSNKSATEIAANYRLQYLLEHGHEPSRDTVVSWIIKLNELDENEVHKIADRPEDLKRFLG